MASVGDVEVCRQCGYPTAAQEFEDMEFWVLCPRCGFHYTEAYGEAAQVKPGYGAIMLRSDNGCECYQRLGSPLTEALAATLAADPEVAYLTRWDPETASVVLVHGAFPAPDADEGEEPEAWTEMPMSDPFAEDPL